VAEPFKNAFDDALVERFVEQLAGPGFDADAFRAAVGELEPLSLKERVTAMADALQAALPGSFPEAVDVLRPRLPPPLPTTQEVASTFGWWPLCTFVERHGLEHPEVALPFLRRLTRTFSAEFAVRPFVVQDPVGTLAVLRGWLDDADPHVRRWISEGSRPRLPWGQRLDAVVADPGLTLPLLEALRHDPEPYVRRSVANHLGDIAKDHPDRAVDVATGWVDGCPVPSRGGSEQQALVRHGLRHLVKKGHPGALALMGFGAATVDAALTVDDQVALGGKLHLDLVLVNPTDRPQSLLVDLGIRFRGADGSLRQPKVFKWTTRELAAGATVRLSREQRLAKVTTRTHYAGVQQVVVLVNGEPVATADFELTV